MSTLPIARYCSSRTSARQASLAGSGRVFSEPVFAIWQVRQSTCRFASSYGSPPL